MFQATLITLIFSVMLQGGNLFALHFLRAEIIRDFQTDNSDKKAKLGIINAMARNLPYPIYPKDALDKEVSGLVKVEVVVDFEKNGKVTEAKAISGHPLLQQASVDAALKAEFTRPNDTNLKTLKGILVYNFILPKKRR